MGTLENKELEENIKVEEAKKEIEKEAKRKEKAKKDKEYDKICSFIYSNEDVISSVLTTHTKGLPITDPEAFNIFEELKSIDADKFIKYSVQVLSFYHFEANSQAPLDLSSLIEWANLIKINKYNNDFEIIDAYKQAYEKIKASEYFSDEQKEQLKKRGSRFYKYFIGLLDYCYA